MSRIVFLSRLFGTLSANAICCENIAGELKKMGHEVTIISYEKTEFAAHRDFIINVTKKSESQDSRFKRVQNLVNIVLGNMSKTLDKEMISLYYNELLKLQKEKPIDTVVAMYFPPESVQAMTMFKKEYPGVKTVIYELDSATDGIKISKLPVFFDRAVLKWLSEKYEALDNVILMKSHKEYWEEHFGKNFGDKLRIADVPVLTEKPQVEARKKDKIMMLYAGIIEKQYRSPSYMLSVLKELDKKTDFDFSFFSRGDCEEEIAKAAEEVKGIKSYGYVPPKELEKATENADILVNIGNSISKSVPSKMITYMSYGKPIIHFSSQEGDVCEEYLKIYPLSLIIDQSEDIKSSSEKIVDFIKETKGKRIEFDKVRELFVKNTPQYSAEIIAE